MKRQPKVHYISLYNIPKFYHENRKYSLSGSKMEYVVDAINDAGYAVNFISLSESRNKRIYLPRSCKWGIVNRFFLAPFIPCCFTESIMFRWLLHIYAALHIHKGDILLVYHTNCMRNDILSRLAQKKKMLFVYEVEEIYAYAREKISSESITEEIEGLQCADKYLFCSELLARDVNIRKKDYAVVEGIYRSHDRKGDFSFDDGKIHIVYSGIVDSVKGGAFNAVKIATYLTDKYMIHILGFGEIDKLQKLISEVQEVSRCQILFEGTKTGKDFDSFIQACDIGLSTQYIAGAFNDSSFPSKVFMYLSNGIRVVSGNIPCIAKSDLKDFIYTYSTDDPKEIAKTIMEIDLSKSFLPQEALNTLDKNFSANLRKLLG